jgi:hypothetical protein
LEHRRQITIILSGVLSLFLATIVLLMNIRGQSSSPSTLSSVPSSLLSPTLSFPSTTPVSPTPEKTDSAKTMCTSRKRIAHLEDATLTNLKKLAEYQEFCNSFVTDRMMYFTTIPSLSQARESAHDMALALLEFSHYGISPLVIAEPDNVPFAQFRDGEYDAAIDAYFSALKRQGITDSQMGMWIPFPEANMPEWDRSGTIPLDFSIMINRYVSILKGYFPDAKAGILLHAKTFLKDYSQDDGSYISLVPYIKGITPGLIDFFGMQGFPWVPQSTNHNADPEIDASIFLPHKLAIEAANTLHIKDIWFNTGTFSKTYIHTPNGVVNISPAKRSSILSTISKELVTVQEAGYNVSINIFAGDKSDTDEGTNWSYWKDGNDVNNPNISVFLGFAKGLYDNNIPLWLFDDISS